MAISKAKNEGCSEIVFFDIETNVPKRPGERFWILEFGAIVVCPRKLVELESFVSLIRPGDLSVVGLRPGRSGAITRYAVSKAPSFQDVADKIFSVLDGRVWAGHNIQRFDCVRIKEAFEAIGRRAPEPAGMIDSLLVLSEKFGRRAGNMKMATLGTYFGLGEQKHRSLDDVRMNLEVVKHCATVLFLESSLPSILNGSWHNSPNVTTRSRSLLEDSSSSPSSSSPNATFTIDTSSVEKKVEQVQRRRNWPNTTSMVTTRSRSYGARLPHMGESSGGSSSVTRKSPPMATLIHQRPRPYTRTNLGKVTESVKNYMLCNVRTRSSLSNILRHSHTLLR